MIYNVNNFPYEDFFKKIDEEKTYKNRTCNYINKFNSFDIETTNLKETREAFMYLFGFSFFNEYIIVGRTWPEFNDFLHKLIVHLRAAHKTLVIFVHNLNFEFMYFKDFIEKYDYTYFAVDKNEPVQVLIENVIEFRCSKKLTSLSLAKSGVKWNSKNRKLNNDDFNLDLDYKKIRTPKTELTEREKAYFLADLKTTAEIPQIIAEHHGDNIRTMPYTATGFIRRKIYKACQTEEYHRIYRTLALNNEIYSMLKDNKKGGDVGVSYNLGSKEKIHYNVESYDEVSAYLYSALIQYVPVSKFKRIDNPTIKIFYEYLNKYCCLFDIEIDEIILKARCDNPIISISHILNADTGAVIESRYNGRLLHGKKILLTLNEIDFECIKKYYDFKHFSIRNFHYAIRGKLPHQIRKIIFELLKEKIDLTPLKDTNKHYIYQQKKEEVNGIIGMMQTDIIHDNIYMDNKKGWKALKNSNSDKDAYLADYFKKYYHFMYYAWPNWIISHSRLNLYELMACCDNHLYHDTDSCKGTNWNKKKLEQYNAERKKNVIKAHYDYKGVYIGTATKEAVYDAFICHNSKQYAYSINDNIEIVSAGMKSKAKSQLKTLADFKTGTIFEDASNTAKYNFMPIHEIEVEGVKITTASNVYIEETEIKLRDYNNIYDILNEPNRKRSV